MDLGNTGYTFVEELPMERLADYSKHRRLGVFYEKGLACVEPGCECVGSRLIVGQDKSGGLHVDVYTDDLILMTVDHINPRWNGGSDHMTNKQPMCRYHNSKKGGILPDGTNPPRHRPNVIPNVSRAELSEMRKYRRQWRKFIRRHATFVVAEFPKTPIQPPKVIRRYLHPIEE